VANAGGIDIGEAAQYFSDIRTGTLNLGDSSDNQTLTGVGDGIDYNVQSGDAHHFRVASTDVIDLDADKFWPLFTNVTDLGTSSLFFQEGFISLLRLNTPAIVQTINGLDTGIEYDVQSGDTHIFKVATLTQMTISSSDVDIGGNSLSGLTVLNWDDGHSISTTASDFFLNIADTGDNFNLRHNSINRFRSTDTQVEILQTTRVARCILIRDDPTPQDDDAIGLIEAKGEDSAGTQRAFAQIQFESQDITATTMDGSIKFFVMQNSNLGSATLLMEISGERNMDMFGNIQMNNNDIGSVQDITPNAADTSVIGGSDTQRFDSIWTQSIVFDNSPLVSMVMSTSGFFFDVTGTDAFQFQVDLDDKMKLDVDTLSLGNSGGLNLSLNATAATHGHITLKELSGDPAAPAANSGRLFLKDDGAGKTELYVIFATGAAQLIASQP